MYGGGVCPGGEDESDSSPFCRGGSGSKRGGAHCSRTLFCKSKCRRAREDKRQQRENTANGSYCRPLWCQEHYLPCRLLPEKLPGGNLCRCQKASGGSVA